MYKVQIAKFLPMMELQPIHEQDVYTVSYALVICMYISFVCKFQVELTWNSCLCHQEFPAMDGEGIHTNDYRITLHKNC